MQQDRVSGIGPLGHLTEPKSFGQQNLRVAGRFLARNLASVTLASLLLGGVVVTASAHAQSAGSWNTKAHNAEAREDYDAAYEAYRQAHLKKPNDLRYKTGYERARFEAANMHVDRGRVLRQSGDLAGAVNEFARALQIDPGNEAAAQELQSSEKARPADATTGPGAAAVTGGGVPNAGQPMIPGVGEQSPYQRKVQQDIAEMAGPIVLKPVSDDPITLHAVEDAKVIYQAIGKAAGLNVIFDPDYQSKRIPVDLTGVSLQDSLRIVGTLSGTFWKPVTSNTIFVAQNNRTKRTDLEDLAVQVFYLTNVSQQNDANEILVALRNLLDPNVHMYLVGSQNAIIMRATPSELTLAEKLINDLDRIRPEVVIDVAVLEVSRQLERNLGITLPTSFGLTPQASNYNVSTSNTATTTTTTSTSSTAASTGVTLNTLANLNATNFAVSISGGTLNALLSDSDTRVLQNPRIRATDGQRATLKIGSKIPVATGSYSAGAAVTTASLGVQTQFTYLDVGVNIDVTPTVHYDREISLKMKIEVSSQNGSVTISSVTEPIIAQKVSEQVIQLKDGEPSILAGLVQKQDSKVVSGTPGLGELPFLKYFFSSQDKTTQSDELVFLIIPHIVRESILTDENTRQIYTGAGGSVELLHRDPPKYAMPAVAPTGEAAGAQGTSAANAANAMIGKIAADARPLSMGAGSTLSVPPGASVPMDANAPGGPVQLSVLPAVSNQAVGATFQVAVTAANARDLASVPMQLQFDPKLLSLVNVDDGGVQGLLGKDGQAVTALHRDDGNGAVSLSVTRPPGVPGVNGQGTICTLTFKAIAPGEATITMARTGAKDSKQASLPTVGTQAIVHVK
ncbi:cohesin domain-containing protein [Granulicella paludicola]|uniref:cohesin domain-containing protein n=1 Tax=Granulicella paludicola TaxID=474951 RepID=UPI0021E0E641|nr:cohesin domain-containing protein [Granulicella paludicola]